MESFSLSSSLNGPIKLEVYHDERGATNQDWLYHAFLFLPLENKNEVMKELIDFRKDWLKELHFKELGDTRTENRVAELWVDYFCRKGYEDFYFYLFGVNVLNLEKQLWKSQTRNAGIYNRFFQIGLYGALKWFFKCKTMNIVKVYSHKKTRESHNCFSTKTLQEIKLKTLLKEEPIVFESPRIKEIAGDHNETALNESYLIQFVDIILGTFGHIYDREGGREGKDLCAKIMLGHGLPKKLMKINSHSRYYKKFAVNFFPRTRLSMDEILNKDPKYLYGNHFYNEREIKFNTQNQLSLKMQSEV